MKKNEQIYKRLSLLVYRPSKRSLSCKLETPCTGQFCSFKWDVQFFMLDFDAIANSECKSTSIHLS